MKFLNRSPAPKSSALIVRSGIALSDQLILSAANFLVTILLIKTLPKHQYGYYSVAFSISLFLVSLQNATVNGPLTVILPSKGNAEKEQYVAALGLGQLLVLVPLTLLVLPVLVLLYFIGLDLLIASIAAALALASTGILLREFLRALYFAQESPTRALRLDALYVLIYLALIGLTAGYLRLSVPAVLFHMGLSGLAVSVHFTLKSRSRVNLGIIAQGYSENWRYAKWALIGVVVTHIQNYSYLYLLASITGSTAVGDVSASRLLLMPFLLLQAGWGRVALPHGCHLTEKQALPRFFREMITATVGVGIAISVYVCLLFFFADPMARLIFTDQYTSSGELILFWGIIYIADFTAFNASLGLLVVKDFRIVTQVNALTMIVTLPLAYFLITHQGIQGALASLLFGYATLAIGLWYFFGLRVFGENGHTLPLILKRMHKWERLIRRRPEVGLHD